MGTIAPHMSTLQATIEAAFERRAEITPSTVDSAVMRAVEDSIGLLDSGKARVSEKKDGKWIVNEWLKKAVLLYFRTHDNEVADAGYARFYDKVPLKYAQATETWRVGSTREVELTVVKNDKRNLSCASDQTIAGLHCGYRRNGREAGRVSPDDAQMLQPYNTTSNQLLLGAGLWTAEELKEPLPEGRFTVVCNYHIKGIMKSAAVRFDPHASFSAVGKTVTAGSLTECVLPR